MASNKPISSTFFQNQNPIQNASRTTGSPGAPSRYSGAIYNGFPQRCSSFISTLKQNQRISFTREWFYEEVAVVPLIDCGLNHNSLQRRCMLLPFTKITEACPVCENVARYRGGRISATVQGRLPRDKTFRTRPQSSVESLSQGIDKPNSKISDYLSQFISVSGTSNRESIHAKDGAQRKERDGDVCYSKDLDSVEDFSDITQSSVVVAQRLEYMRKTNQVLKYYIDMEEDRLKMCSVNGKFSLQNIHIPTSTSQRPHSNIHISTPTFQHPHLNAHIPTSTSQRPHSNIIK